MAVLVLGVPIRLYAGTWEGASVGACFGLAVVIALGAMTWKLRYIITDHELIAKSATFELVVPLTAIRSIQPNHSFTPAACLSAKRVRVALWHRSIILAPVNRDNFIAELAARCKQQGEKSTS